MRNPNLKPADIKVMAFDWDNTLANNRDTIVNSINRILAQYSLPDWEKARHLCNPTLSLAENFPLLFGEHAQTAYTKYCTVYLEMYAQFTKQPDYAEDVLLWCIKNNVRIAVVTNKTQNLLMAELPYLYPRIKFDNILCGDDKYQNKPHPEQLQFAAQKWVTRITPDTVWMVGDSFVDSNCALAAGAQAVRIGLPIWNDSKEKEDERIAYYDNFEQFYAMLKR